MNTNIHSVSAATQRIRFLAATCLAMLGSLCHLQCDEIEPGLRLGGIVSNRVLTTDDSPVLITNHTTFVNVTIAPGTVVWVGGPYTIATPSGFAAIGTEAQPIRFQAAPDNTNGWQGFLFDYAVPNSEFDWCVIEDATNSALRLIHSAPTIRNTKFIHNTGVNGGAIFGNIGSGINLSITNCVFTNNTANQDGGAMWVTLAGGTLNVVDCEFDDNQANPAYTTRHTIGGAIRLDGNARIVRTRFKSNRSHAYTIYARYGIYTRGGALWITGNSVQITACEFIDNASAMTAHGQTPDPSYAYGGAIYFESGNLLIENTLFATNWLSAQRSHAYHGSALFINSGEATVRNCTFGGNSSAEAIHNLSGLLSVHNSILYFNNNAGVQIGGVASVSYSDVQNGYDGVGNINLNPIFNDTYRIVSGSPAVDAGDPAAGYADVAFPPSLGTGRNDLGFLGGPGAVNWTAPVGTPVERFAIIQNTIFEWLDRPGVQLLHAVSPIGPWYPYEGEIHTNGYLRYVIADRNTPRRFFRLIRPLSAP